jgi:hypothetical protein
MCALILNILAVTFDKTTIMFRLFHPSPKIEFPPFVDDLYLKLFKLYMLKKNRIDTFTIFVI